MVTMDSQNVYFSKLPNNQDWTALRKTIKVGNKTVNNRIVYQAMEGCDGTSDGAPDTLTFRRYQRYSAGGPGVIWIEATSVVPEGRANPRQLYICKETLDDFKRLCEMIKETGLRENGYEPFVSVQLTHSGRHSKPNGVPEPIIAYRNPYFEKKVAVTDENIISDDELDRVSEAMVNGARLVEQAGFDSADIKACHGYLLCELLSAYDRPGKYGGSFENRTRLLRESITEAVKSCSSEFVISSRLNIYDGFPYPYGFGTKLGCGLDPDYSEAKQMVLDLANAGVGLFNLTMGNPYVNPHVNRPSKICPYTPDEPAIAGVARMLTGISEVANVVKDRVPVVCSGLSYLAEEAPNVAAGCVGEGWFDFAGFGREAFAYPNIAKDICAGTTPDKKKLCVTCSKCTELMRNGGTTGCIIRDADVYAPLYKQYVLKK